MGKWEMKIKIFSNSRVDMPLKTYKKGRKVARRRYTKKPQMRRRSKMSLVKLIQKVSLKKAETKQAYTIIENVQLYHNVPNIKQDFLYTTQGITATDTGTSAYSNRLGDEVIARGISFKFWIANKLDRPNVMYRLVIFRYTSGDTISANDVFLSASTNYMIKDYNTDKIKVLYSRIINLQVGVSGTLPVGTDASKWGQKEAHKLLKVWIPLKDKKIKYDGDVSGVPKWTDIGFAIVPYDSYGTLTTDNIASYAYHSKFYFKDP